MSPGWAVVDFSHCLKPGLGGGQDFRERERNGRMEERKDELRKKDG
jgi:hypothetical protein